MVGKNEIMDYHLVLVGESDPGKIICLVAETAARLINAETVAVPMVSHDKLDVRYDYACGRHKAAFEHAVMPIESAGLCGWVLENRVTIVSPNVMEDPRVPKDMAKALGITTAVVAPLIARGRIIGGLSAFNRKDGLPFTEEDASALTRLANYAALIIDNALLMTELNRERKELQAILDGAKDGIVFLTMDGVITSVNNAMEKFIPMKAHEMVGVNVSEFASIGALAGLFDWYAAAEPGRRCWEVLACREASCCPMYHSDRLRCWSFSDGHCHNAQFEGKEDEKHRQACSECLVQLEASKRLAMPREVSVMGRDVQVTSALVVHEGKDDIFGEVMVFHDITAEKQLAKKRSEFMAMIMHDIRSPLTSITGYSSLLSTETDIGKIKDMAGALTQNANRLLRMTEDLTTLSRLEAGELKLEPVPISMTDFIPKVCKLFLAQAGENGQVLSWEVSENTPEVMADADKIHRIVYNLLSNSVKYVQPGGNIKISSCGSEGGMVEIAVEDNGPGIPVEDLPMIFERYYTAGKHRMHRGSGLGLAIVHALTEAQSGMVSVASGPGKLTRFSVFLPAASSPAVKSVD